MVGKKMEDLGLMALFFCPPFFCHFKCTTHISVDVNMPFNVNAFQSDQNVVDVLDSGCQNVHDHRAAGVIAPFKTRAVGGSACIMLLSDVFCIGTRVVQRCICISFSVNGDLCK